MGFLPGVISFPLRLVFICAVIAVQLLFLAWFLNMAYDIRMYPIQDFGMVIHEFDPWFNYRAAEYLVQHGFEPFFKWYDHMSWYPIGRPVGTTIYPGMQITAYAIREGMLKVPAFVYDIPSNPLLAKLRELTKYLKKEGAYYVPNIPKKIDYAPMSVNDICCLIPAWFGSIASLFTGLLTYEISRSVNAGLVAVGIMAVLPAHLMRSVGGKFDNECVAMAAISCTFWLWLRCIRTPKSWPWAVPAALSYFNMVLAWGGYIFVINMIGAHAALLVLLGRFNSGVHKAYSIFYVIGTYLAMQIPVVGWQPVRSLEQIVPLLAFLGYQGLAFCDYMRRKRKMETKEFVLFRIKVVFLCILALFGVAAMLYPTGYFGPLSARIRGLFVPHTKTGNPLVDSVAEHRPTSADAYDRYLNWPLGYALQGMIVCAYQRTSGSYFAFLYAFVAATFSSKMSRLVLICAPICTVGAGLWFGFLLDFLLEPFLLLLGKKGYEAPASDSPKKGSKAEDSSSKPKAKAKAKAKKDSKERELLEYEEELRPGGMAMIMEVSENNLKEIIGQDTIQKYQAARVAADTQITFVLPRVLLSLAGAFALFHHTKAPIKAFFQHCDGTARAMSNAKVVRWERTRDGKPILMDDYFKGYKWLDQNTPKDARVIAWWDYGYQITGIGNRTSLADGNTWNHEHIATLGRTLTSHEKKAWNVIRHLADYVLVWAGGQGDDLGKSPHLARIGNSVFPDHCGDNDPKCNKFGFNADRSPTPMMAQSLLYRAVMHNLGNGVSLNEKYFKEVHTTKFGRMRIFKVMNISEESRDWIADPKNRICDAPGSWYCVGQYPPALDKLIAKRRNFAQVEDFNKGGEKSAYTRMVEQERAGASAGGKKKKEL